MKISIILFYPGTKQLMFDSIRIPRDFAVGDRFKFYPSTLLR